MGLHRQLCALAATAAAFTTPPTQHATSALRSSFQTHPAADYLEVERREVERAAQTAVDALRSNGAPLDPATEEAAWEAAWIAASVANVERLKIKQDAAARVADRVPAYVPPLGGRVAGAVDEFVADKPAYAEAATSSAPSWLGAQAAPEPAPEDVFRGYAPDPRGPDRRAGAETFRDADPWMRRDARPPRFATPRDPHAYGGGMPNPIVPGGYARDPRDPRERGAYPEDPRDPRFEAPPGGDVRGYGQDPRDMRGPGGFQQDPRDMRGPGGYQQDPREMRGPGGYGRQDPRNPRFAPENVRSYSPDPRDEPMGGLGNLPQDPRDPRYLRPRDLRTYDSSAAYGGAPRQRSMWGNSVVPRNEPKAAAGRAGNEKFRDEDPSVRSGARRRVRR